MKKTIITSLLCLIFANSAMALSFTKIDEISYLAQVEIGQTSTVVTSDIGYPMTWTVFTDADIYLDALATTANTSDIPVPGNGYWTSAGDSSDKHTRIVNTTGIAVIGSSSSANLTIITQMER